MTTATSGDVGRVEERDVDVRGTRIRLLTCGAGPPLLYLHGAGDLGAWPDALTGLAERCTVYRPDHPGFSGSDDRAGIDSIHDLAFFYLDLLDALELDAVALVGASLGGWLAADLATLAPSRADRLVLVDAAGVRAEADAPDMFTLSPPELAAVLYHGEAARAAAVEQASGIEADATVFDRYLRNRMATAHLGWNPYLHDPKLPGRLHRVTAPTLIVWGVQDRLLPVAYARRWAELLPAARLEMIEDAGHLPFIEQPDAFVSAVGGFVTR